MMKKYRVIIGNNFTQVVFVEAANEAAAISQAQQITSIGGPWIVEEVTCPNQLAPFNPGSPSPTRFTPPSLTSCDCL
jgi:hypothetical protein